MTKLMLNPKWPGAFRRTVSVGKKTRLIVFKKDQPVDVSDAELKQLEPEIGNAIFEIELDEKGRPRFLEAVSAEDSAGNMELKAGDNAANF